LIFNQGEPNMSRLLLSFLLLAIYASPIQTFAATTVASDTAANNLVNRFVQNATTINVTAATSIAIGATNQIGLVTTTNLGTIQVNLLPAAATPVTIGTAIAPNNLTGSIILTNGNIGGTTNIGGTGSTIGSQGDANITTASGIGSFDAASLQFDFTVTGNPAPTAVTFELVFASNETIGAVNPDTAIVMVDGVNFAKLNNGGLLNNQTARILIAGTPAIVSGFNNASQTQTVTAVLDPNLTTHRIKIAIADSIDRLRDSAVIVANFRAITSPQGGMGVGDIFPPVITLDPAVGAAITKEATALLTPVNLGAVTVTDNFTPPNPLPQATPVPAGPYAVGATAVTWSATDAAGNIGTVTQTVTIIDTTPPVVTAPAAKTFSTADPNMATAITTYLNTVTATDAVGIVGAITNNVPPGGFPLGATTITFTATDAALNAGTATTIVTIVSTSITATSNATALTTQLNQDPNITIITPTTAVIAANQTGLVNSTNLGVLIPAAPPLLAVSLLLPKQGIMLTTGNITGTGNNLNAPNAAIGADADVSTALIGNARFNTTGTFDASSLQFSFTVVGNPTSINFDFIYATNEAIGGTAFPDAAVVMVDGINRAVFNNGLLLSNLNGAFLTATNGTLVPGFTNVSQVQRLTATLDPLRTTHSVKITIADNNDGLVDSALIISNMTSSNSTQNGMGVGDIFPPIITLNPPTAILDPIFPNTLNVAIEANAPLSNINLGAPTVTDNVDIGLRATATPAGPYAVGVRLVTWTAIDAAGNVGTATQTVTVNDTTPPVVTAPAAKAFLRTSPTLNADITAYLATATAVDIVGVVLPITNNAPAAGFPAGATTVTISATDAAANIGTATTIITITGDTIPPILTPPTAANFAASSSAGLAANNGALAAHLANVTATDAGGIRSITNNAPTIFPVGVTTVTYTATDNFGNTATASSNITITAFIAGGGTVPVANGIDQIPPRIKLVGSKQMKVLQTAVGIVALFVDPGATVVDNFDGVTPGIIPATTSIDTSIVGRTILTYRATDAAGNSASTIRTVDVVAPIAGVDLLPPTVTPPADILVASTSFSGIAKADPSLNAFFGTFAVPTVTAVDNIGLAGAISNNAPATIPVGKTIITFTAKDIQGNIGTADAVITVTGIAQNPGTATDFDADGIPDAWENQVFGNLITAAAATDFDLDGITDAMERILGTNPKAVNSNISGASTDLKDAVFLNNPSDSDNDGISDILEDNASVLDASVVTGIPAATGATTFTIRGNGSPIQSVAVNQTGSAPVNIISSYGVLSYNVLTSIGGTATIQINSSQPFGTNAQYYKVDAAGNYSLIPASNITQIGANTINLTLTDGGAFDLDGVANGVIVDPIAFGQAPQVLGANGGIGGGGCVLQGNSTSTDPLLPACILLSILWMMYRRNKAT